jgi:enoyl-CoA hydratase/carnithine racemase
VGLPEVNLGVLPGTGGTQRLARLIGKSRAIELMATGELFEFERAQELGIVNRVFDGENFDEQVHDFARQFCPPNRAAKAVGRIKRSVQSGAEVPFESGLAIERELQQQLFESADAREGLDASVAKRKPQFAGR